MAVLRVIIRVKLITIFRKNQVTR